MHEPKPLPENGGQKTEDGGRKMEDGRQTAEGGAVPSDAKAASALTPEEQMALYEQDLKEKDWGPQPCARRARRAAVER
jgi:hypothetical protein